MSYANTATRPTVVAGIRDGLRSGIASFMSAYNHGAERRRVYRQTVAELQLLTDRELNDLGISRSMITRIALEAANQK
ncbi:DUF1127 domain-containing protein [Thioclava sp. BHET1]|nr:DUF1127 domain-containing protein [Thioclava sp. BHET1]